MKRVSRSGSVANAFGKIFSATCPVQLGISGLIDLAHAPLADEGGDVIVAEAGTDT